MTWNKRLLNAAIENYLEDIALCLRNGADINAVDEQGWTTLMRAIGNGYNEVANRLIDNDANLDLQSQEGYTALMVAAENNHANLVDTLIARGANANLQTTDGDSALILALSQKHWLVAKKLIDNNARVNLANSDNDTELIIATNAFGSSDNPELTLDVITLLLDKGANVNAGNNNGDTALIFAARNNHIEIVNVLIEKGANVNLQTADLDSALILALIEEHWLVAKKLIDSNARVNLANEDDDTALIIATNALGASNNPELEFDVIKLLIQRGANVNAVNHKGYTALINATLNDHEQLVDALLKANANNVFQKNNHNKTALAYAAETGNLALVKKLIDTQNSLSPTDENLANQNLNLALSFALERGHKSVASLLCSQENIRLNETNRAKITALKKAESINFTDLALSLGLHHAAGSFDLINLIHGFLHPLFLPSGSRKTIVRSANRHHSQALNKKLLQAAHNGDINKLKALINRKADINFTDSIGQTPLMLASARGHLPIIKALLGKAKLDIQCNNGRTALMYASGMGQYAVVQALLCAGADSNLLNVRGKSALSYAHHNGYPDITNLLKDFDAQKNSDEPKAKRQKITKQASHQNDGWSARFFNGSQSFDCDDEPLEPYQ